MELLYTAFLLGIMGSFHCVGMCGPIALSLPLRGKSIFEKIIGGIFYNTGRTLMYGFMGGIFGLIGQGFQLLGFQRWVSLAMGIILVLSVLFPFLFKNSRFQYFSSFTGLVRKGIQRLFTFRSYGGLFFIGTLNSLLPCGLVYMAIAGSIAVGNVYYGMLYMILFGLGTIPMMLGITLLGNAISIGVRNRINKVIPYMVIVIGVIFIFRGLCLGIPFLSPSKEKLDQAIHPKIIEQQSVKEDVKGACCHAK
jgi:sulfite exporter TauE/SafE